MSREFVYNNSVGRAKIQNKNPYGVIGRPKPRLATPPGLHNATESAGYIPPAQRELRTARDAYTSPLARNTTTSPTSASRNIKRDPSLPYNQNYQAHLEANDDFKRSPSSSYIPPAQRNENPAKPNYFNRTSKDQFEENMSKREPNSTYAPSIQRSFQKNQFQETAAKREPRRGYVPPAQRQLVSPKRDPSSPTQFYPPARTISPEHSPSPSNGYVPPAQRVTARNQFDANYAKRDPSFAQSMFSSRQQRSPEASPTPSSTSSTRSYPAFSSPTKSVHSVHSQVSLNTSPPDMNFQAGSKQRGSNVQRESEAMKNLQKQILKLNKKLQAHEKRQKDSEVEIKKLRNQVKLKAQELAKKSKLYTDLKCTRDNSQMALEELQSRLEESEKELGILRVENKNMLSNSRKIKGELKRTKGINRAELALKAEEVDQLQKSLSEVQKNLLQAQDLQELERKAYRKEIEKEQRKADESESEHRELLIKFRAQTRELEMVQTRLDEKQKVITSQKVQLERLEDTAIRLKHKEKEVLSLRAEARQPRASFTQDLVLKKKEEEIDKLKNQLKSRNDFSKQFRVQIINKQQEIERLTEEKMEFQENLAEYEEKIFLLEEKISSIEEKQAGPPPELIFQEEMVDLMMQLKEKELELQEMKSQMQNNNSHVEKVRNYEKAFQHVQAEMQKLEASRNVFQKEIAIQKKEIKEQKLLILQQTEEKKHLEENLSTVSEEKGKYLQLLENLQVENGDVNESLISERDMLRGDLENERVKQQAHRAELEAARNEIEKLKYDLVKSKDLEARLNKVAESREVLQAELRQAKTDLEDIHLDSRKTEDLLKEQLESKENDIQTQRAIIEELQRRVESDLGLSEGPPTPTVSPGGNGQEVFRLKQMIAEQKTTIENLLVDQASSVGVTSDDDAVERYEAQLAEYEIKSMEMENEINELRKQLRLNSGAIQESAQQDYQRIISSLEERIAVMQNMQKSNQIVKSDGRRGETEARIAQLEAENLENLELVAEFEEKIASLNEALEATKGDTENLIPQARYQADIDQYQAEIGEFQQIIEQFQKREKRFLAESKKYQIKIDMMEQILEAQKNEDLLDKPSADANEDLRVSELKLKYEAEIEKLKNMLKLNKDTLVSKESKLSEARESVKVKQQSLEKSLASIEERDRRITELEEVLQSKQSITEAPVSEESFEKLTVEIEQKKLESQELKRTIAERTQTIDNLQETITNMENDTAHKDRLAEGFQKKAIKAMKENKEFSQTLQNYREELEDKSSIITELVEQVKSLIQSEAASREMNKKLETMLVESSQLRKDAFSDLKESFAI